MAELIPLTETEAVLREFADAVAQAYKDNLKRDGRPASGDLERSIKTNVEVNGASYEVTMTLNEYWKYIEYGTKGRLTGNIWRKFPPVSAILHWIEVKPSIPKPATIDEWNRRAYLIGRKIRDFGTKGKADLMEAKMETMEQFRSRLSQALAHDMAGYIRKVLAPKT